MTVQGSSFLVTGGAGFIGSHLVEGLLHHGARQVIVLDNLRSGRWEHLKESQRYFSRQLRLVEADFARMTESALNDVLKGVDYIYHLAAEKDNQARILPEHLLQVNISGAYRLFRLASEAGVRKVIFTSSQDAYGQMTSPALVETQSCRPQSVYGVSKLTAEQLLHQLALQTRLNYTILRLFSVYGPRQWAGVGHCGILLRHLEQIVTGQPPVIFGDGTQVLDYVFVDDVVRALLFSLNQRADGELINIGSGQGVSVNEITRALLTLTGSALRPVYTAPDWTDGSYRVCDPSKAAKRLNWIPTISLEDGLRRIYRWFLTVYSPTPLDNSASSPKAS